MIYAVAHVSYVLFQIFIELPKFTAITTREYACHCIAPGWNVFAFIATNAPASIIMNLFWWILCPRWSSVQGLTVICLFISLVCLADHRCQSNLQLQWVSQISPKYLGRTVVNSARGLSEEGCGLVNRGNPACSYLINWSVCECGLANMFTKSSVA